MIAALALRLGIPKAGIYAALGVIAFLAVAAVILIADRNGYNRAKSKYEAERATANVIAITTARNADEAAAVERVESALVLAEKKTELTNAIAETPDTAPDAVRVRLGCERLRQAGTLDAGVPAICGRASGN